MAVASKGIDIRQALGGHLVFRATLKDSAGAALTSGQADLSLYELQSDGTIKTYDFNDDTFKTGVVGIEDLVMTLRKGNNNSTDRGLWTAPLATLTGFVNGAVYIAVVEHPTAMPPQQEREFQFGGAESDMTLTGTNINSHLSGAVDAVLTAAKFHADYFTAIAAAVWNALLATYNLVNSFGARIQLLLQTAGYTAPPTAAQNATQVRVELGTELARIDVLTSSRAAPGAQMDLIDAPNVNARHSIATIVEQHLLDEGDAQLLINAIVGAIGNLNVNEVALVALIRADLERNGGDLDTLVARLTNQRATNLDNLDVLVSSRMATFVYTAPDNANILIAASEAVIAASKSALNNDILNKYDALLQAIPGPAFVFTAEALQNAPVGGGGGDATAANQVIMDGKLDQIIIDIAGIVGGGGGSGPGADACSFFINVGGVAVADAQVWITSDEAGTLIIAGYLTSDSEGIVTFLLDAGNTYYLWMQKDGVNPILGLEFIAAAG